MVISDRIPDLAQQAEKDTPMARNFESTNYYIELEARYGASNYNPLDLVIAEAKGVWVTDVEGKKYLDGLAAYSSLNQGHCHPRILQTLVEQAGRVTLTSRAFRNSELPLFEKELCELTAPHLLLGPSGTARVLPMNTGAEAVETAIKAARRWGYRKKGIAPEQAQIITFAGNFHGRTTTIVSFSSEPSYRADFGPFTPGFTILPFGDIEAVRKEFARAASRTAAVLIEPIQAESGVLIPPPNFLRELSALCKEHDVLLLLDEIQTGLGRTGTMFSCDHEGVKPDAFILGKALSGGFYPVSALVARTEVLEVFEPGSHGSTYGGNPLGCAVARTALKVLVEEDLCGRADRLGRRLLDELKKLRGPAIAEIRGRGLLIGIELTGPARPYCEALARLGVLCKETHDNVLRFAPPLIITEEELDWAFERLARVLAADAAALAAA
jgi:ornithine--oxo-acid transaminase